MSHTHGPFTEAELHAYVDGQLPLEIHERVAAWLETDPQSAAMVAQWQAQNAAIRALFARSGAHTFSGNAPAQKAPPRTARSWWRGAAMAACAVLIFALGAASGHYTQVILAPETMQSARNLSRHAAEAYLVYASEVRHPVEVFAKDEAHLAAWLGKRLSTSDLRVPDLQTLGFSLVGGRLVPVDGQPGALFMYENRAGERITIMVGRDSGNRTTSFRSAASGKLETFYWVDGDFGYAVTGEIPRSLLYAIATESYRQFQA